MKIAKLSILALTIGMFATSCDTKTEENTVVEGDTTMVTPAPVMVEPAAPAVVDTTNMNNMSTPAMEPATTTPAAPGTPATAPAEMK